MRRRRKNNPLLMRIIGISILAHVVALPIAAKFGVFKKVQQHFSGSPVIVVSTSVEKDKPKAEMKKTPPTKAEHKAVARRPASSPHPAPPGPKQNLNAPKMMVATNTGSGGDSGAGVQQGNGAAGVVPTPKTEPPAPQQPQQPVVPPTPLTPPVVPPVPPTPPVTIPKPPVPVEPVKPILVAPPAHDPVFTAVEVASSPQPIIPDDLRSDALDKTCVVEVTVSPEGTLSAVKISRASGNDELDRIALDAARQYKFKPALRDGQPVEGRALVTIHFRVS